ncbi:MAG: FixH family protein [Alphaproteobacteria bacterium]|nr:FixH family protein [Alphaproteobacteria bacterium]MDD9920148.1 FixH family protein [Alphaproteobacteria bacterium]
MPMHRIVLISLLTFFGIICIANGIMIYLASTSWNGLTHQHAYERGLTFNNVLTQKKQEEQLGWHVAYTFTQTAPTKASLYLQVTNKNKQPLENATITLTLKRPIEGGEDITYTMAPATQKGAFKQQLTVPKIGQWEATAHITTGTNTLTTHQRLFFAKTVKE